MASRNHSVFTFTPHLISWNEIRYTHHRILLCWNAYWRLVLGRLSGNNVTTDHIIRLQNHRNYWESSQINNQGVRCPFHHGILESKRLFRSTLRSQSIPELHTPLQARVQQLSVSQDYCVLHPDSVDQVFSVNTVFKVATPVLLSMHRVMNPSIYAGF